MLAELNTIWVPKNRFLNGQEKTGSGILGFLSHYSRENRGWFQIDSNGTKHIIQKMDENCLHFFEERYGAQVSD